MTVPRFRRGQNLGANALNKLVDEVNALGAVPAGTDVDLGFRAELILYLEIRDVNPSDLDCVMPGESGNPTAEVWTVTLPQIYTEASRNFGGAIGNVTYVYTDINTRTATGTSGSETQYLTPPLIAGEMVEARDDDGLTWRMIADGRMWAVDPPP